MNNKMIFRSIVLALFAVSIFFSQAQARTTVLTLSYHFPAVSETARTLAEWSKKIEERTEGRVKIKAYPSATLAHFGDAYESVKAGIADIAFTAVNGETEAWPLSQVLIQPLAGAPVRKGSVDFYKEVMASIPELAEEMSDIKMLMMWNTAAETHVHTTKKLVRIPDDIAGMKMIAIGQISHYAKGMKANPINLSPNDFFAALERGVAEGCLLPLHVLNIHGLTELTHYHLILDAAATRFQLIMNLDRWNALSSKDQKILDELSDWAAYKLTSGVSKSYQAALEKAKKLGHSIIYPTPEETKKWKEGGRLMLQKWIEENEAKGRPAKAIFEKVKRIAQKYQ